MMRRLACTGLVLAALVGAASANGRPPNTSTINFRKGHETDIAAGLTFGLVLSHDNGVTWHWMCEVAIMYSGMYDPDYAYSSSGALFATTFDGLLEERDGCSFALSSLAPPAPATKLFSQVTIGPDGAVYTAASDATDGHIYKSTDDGLTFPTSTMPGMINDWWQSMEVAPSDATRVYLTGYRFIPNPDHDAGTVKQFVLEKSVDGGANFTPMQMTGISPTSTNTAIEIAGISKTDPSVVYARVTLQTGVIGDAIYRSANSGTTWTKILDKPDQLSFVVRNNGDLVAGTQTVGSFVSHDEGTTWTPLVGPPHINCLVENAAGEVWACTQNYGANQVPPDGWGIMKSTDLATWTGVLKFQDIAGPVDCPAGTLQHDQCDSMLWCGLTCQLGITTTRVCACAASDDPVNSDAATGPVKPKGCCETGDSSLGAGALLLGLIVGMVLLRPRRS